MVSDACHWACILQVMYDNIVIISSMLSFVAECRTNCAVISLATIQDSGLLMNFCRPSKSIWSSLFRTWHWLQDKIASLSWGMTIFFGLFYIHLKGVFFFYLWSFVDKMLSAPCFQNCQHVQNYMVQNVYEVQSSTTKKFHMPCHEWRIYDVLIAGACNGDVKILIG